MGAGVSGCDGDVIGQNRGTPLMDLVAIVM